MSYGKNEFVDLHTRTKLSSTFLIITIISFLLSIIGDIRVLKLIKKVKLGGYADNREIDSIDSFLGGVGMFILTVGILSFIFYLIWIHRAYSNLPSFGADIKTSPGMAVIYFFIPFANLVMPYKIVKEIWEKSITRGNYEQFKEKITSSIIVLWWVLVIGGGVVSRFDSGLHDKVSSLEDLILSSYVSIATCLVFIGQLVVLLIIVNSINKMQHGKHEAVMINPELEKEEKPIFSSLTD